MGKFNITALRSKRAAGDKLSCVTAYDASFAAQIDAAEIDMILVGDSLGMVIQGQNATLPVTVDEMIYHAAMVRRGAPGAFMIVDMPFLSYSSNSEAIRHAGRIMKETGADMVKLEGGESVVERVSALIEQGIPVCAHLGLLPQSVRRLGGYRVQGRDAESALLMRDSALQLQQAGASAIVLECIPQVLASDITQSLEIATIGIGAGPDCDGQVLVLYDLLGITPGKSPSFSKDFLAEYGSVPKALAGFAKAVKQGQFPGAEQSFT